MENHPSCSAQALSIVPGRIQFRLCVHGTSPAYLADSDRTFPMAAVAGVEQSGSTDQGRLVAAVFSTTDKGPSVSAVVQLTSDYCLPSFLGSTPER